MISVTSQNVSFGHRSLARHAERAAAHAAGIISSHFGPLPGVQVLVSSRTDALADFIHESKLALLPGAELREVAQQLRWERRGLRGKYGATELSAGGIVLALNLGKARTVADVNETLTHELVHAYQLSGDDAREEHLAYLRYGFEIEPLPRRKVRAYERVMDRREREARDAERLASQIPA
ncbi:mitochondrial inner membrane protease ATP23 [Streptomyces sp. NBC_01433]|uniref:hypothetical protein n=1 Tax=Streptomyces sp. NBC_01433 TaxID=2903864 RepID=UPI00225BA60C|nr:hypothetical protein [Streptomyces sp. NBC_01433]MCX4682461.1 mitochondrial inner membrane protease ATP23 [Streptomyces sp. NBC_01433]MCX4682514.1 mitochondrial inner membrane protease ATP23 [Streptomyces sp. NBC_01433]